MGADLWAADHPVLTVLRARHARGSRPGARTDGFKVGLAVEGGGMRGVVSGAMIVALADLGYTEAFDVVYGASAGAINAAYLLAGPGSGWYSLSVYWDELTDPQFVNPRRLLSGGSVMDLDFLIETVMEDHIPLDYPAVLDSPIPLHVAVTLVDEMRTESATGFVSREDLKSALRASTWLPVVLKGTATFRGQRAVDGAILTPHPFQLALADGCTHVLSLSTKPMRPPAARPNGAQLLAARHLERLRPRLGREYLAALDRYREERRWLQRSMSIPEGPVLVLDLAPLATTRKINHLEFNPGRLIEAARSAYRLVYCALEELAISEPRNGRLRVVPRFTIVRDGVAHPMR